MRMAGGVRAAIAKNNGIMMHATLLY